MAAETEFREKRHEDNERRWYVINTLTGHEKRVAEDIMRRAEARDMRHMIHRTLVPERIVNVYQDGKRKQQRQPIYPGYVYVQMNLTDETWYVVRNTPGVTGFVGTKTIPIPVTEEEMERIFRYMKLTDKKVTFEVGDRVQFIDGPFMFRKGTIIALDQERRRAYLELESWGRILRTEVSFDDIERLETADEAAAT